MFRNKLKVFFTKKSKFFSSARYFFPMNLPELSQHTFIERQQSKVSHLIDCWKQKNVFDQNIFRNFLPFHPMLDKLGLNFILDFSLSKAKALNVVRRTSWVTSH